MEKVKQIFDDMMVNWRPGGADFLTSIAAINTLLMPEEACVEVVTAPFASSLVRFLVHSIMNQPDVPTKTKLAALAVLVHLSRVPDETFRTEVLFNQVVCLERSLDLLLKQKEQSANEMGVALGRQHEQVIVLLMRCTNYSLTASHIVNEFCDGRVAFAMELMISVFKVQTHELELRENAIRCIYQLTLPQTYFASNGRPAAISSPASTPPVVSSPISPSAATTLQEVELSAFGSKIDTMIDTAMRQNLNQTLTQEFSLLVAQQYYDKFLQRWANIMKFFASTYLNLLRFSTKSERSRSWQQSVMVSHPEVFTIVTLPHLKSAAEWVDAQLRSSANATSTAAAAGGKPGETDLERSLRPVMASFSCSYRFLCVATFSPSGGAIGAAATVAQLRELLLEASHATLSLPPMFLRRNVQVVAHLLQAHSSLNTLEGYNQGTPSPDAKSTPAQLRFTHELRTLVAILAGSRRVVENTSQPTTDLGYLWMLVCNAAEATFLNVETETFKAIQLMIEPVVANAAHAAVEMSPSPNRDDSDSVDEEEDELDRMALALDKNIGELEDAIEEVRTARRELDEVSPSRRDAKAAKSQDDPASPLAGLPPLSISGASPVDKSEKKKRSKSKRTKTTLSGAALPKDVPSEFLCMLTQRLMQHPVRLPNGNVYELEQLKRVVDSVGHVDPLTGEAMDFELEVDLGLQRRVMQYAVSHALEHDHEVMF